jgi:predicted Ser/Thr protein kinase
MTTSRPIALQEKSSQLRQRIERLVESGHSDAVEVLLAEVLELGSNEQLLVDGIYAEFCAREKLGLTPELSHYLNRFPQLSEPIRSLFESHASIAHQDSTQFPSTDPNRTADTAPIQVPARPNGSPSAVEAETYVPAARSHLNIVGRIENYEIVEEIARGGMGVVYKAIDGQLDRIVALKTIKSGELANAEQVRRFQLEAKAAAQLDHPGIVPVYEVGQHGNQHFLTMAHIEGKSLWQRVKEQPLKPELAARMMQQVAEAIQHAHSKGIIHRDVKPQNILVTKSGQPKVTDFGLAKRQERDSSLTATGQVLGTPSFMPPEQVKGKTDETGPLSDVYSLGATLYCLLTGRPPFQAATVLETMQQVVE